MIRQQFGQRFIKSFIYLSLLVAAIAVTTASATERVAMIQAVSTSKKTFAIRQGHIDGVKKGQEALFTNKNTSFKAIAKEVNNSHSLWEIADRRAAVPFERGDIITFTNFTKNIWTEIAAIKAQPKSIGFKQSNYWIVRGYASMSMNQSSSEVEINRQKSRTGLQMESLYLRRFRYNMEWGVGFRVDREIAPLEGPNIDTVTYRNMAVAEANYLHTGQQSDDKYIFLGLGLAYGTSSTVVGSKSQSGIVLGFPILSLGHTFPVSEKYKMTVAASAESLSSKEKFADGKSQGHNVTNAKISLGLKF